MIYEEARSLDSSNNKEALAKVVTKYIKFLKKERKIWTKWVGEGSNKLTDAEYMLYPSIDDFGNEVFTPTAPFRQSPTFHNFLKVNPEAEHNSNTLLLFQQYLNKKD